MGYSGLFDKICMCHSHELPLGDGTVGSCLHQVCCTISRCICTIVSHKDTRYSSHFCKTLQEAMCSTLLDGTSFHPQSDGQMERKNQILEDMLRAISMEWQGSWDDHLDLVQFSYNNSYQATTQMALLRLCMGVVPEV